MKKLFSLAFMAMLVPFAVNAETTCDVDLLSYTDEYIQCLINDAVDNSESTVTIPTGTYTIDESISIESSIILTAEEDVILNVTGSKVAAITIAKDVDVTISNFEINAASEYLYTYLIIIGEKDVESTGSVIIDSMDLSSYAYGIRVYSGEFTLKNSTIDDATEGSIYGGNAVYLYGVENATISDNTITSPVIDGDVDYNTTGILLANNSSATISGNKITSAVGVNVYVGSSIINEDKVNSVNEFIDTEVIENDYAVVVYLDTTNTLYVSDAANIEGDAYFFTEDNGVTYYATSNAYSDLIEAKDASIAGKDDVVILNGEFTVSDADVYAVVNNTTVTVAESATITIEGEATLKINGTLVNNGTIIVNGILTLGNNYSYSGDGSITIASANEVTISESEDSDVDYVLGDTFADVIANTLVNKFEYAAFVLGKNTVSVEVSVVEVASDSTDAAEAISAMTAATKGTVVSFFDITLSLSDGIDSMNITNLDDTITITIPMPEGLDAVADGYEREFYILRYHGEEVITVEGVVSEDGTTISFETDSFSNYSVAFIDAEVTVDDTVENPSTGDAIVTAAVVGGISLIALAGVSLKLKRN